MYPWAIVAGRLLPTLAAAAASSLPAQPGVGPWRVGSAGRTAAATAVCRSGRLGGNLAL